MQNAPKNPTDFASLGGADILQARPELLDPNFWHMVLANTTFRTAPVRGLDPAKPTECLHAYLDEIHAGNVEKAAVEIWGWTTTHAINRLLQLHRAERREAAEISR